MSSDLIKKVIHESKSLIKKLKMESVKDIEQAKKTLHEDAREMGLEVKE